MIKFVFNIAAFGISVLLVLNLFKATLPFYWANEEICDKMALFESDSTGFDLVYFGPSAVKREFIPSVFDSSLNSMEIRAFNFGTAGVYYAEEDFLVRHAIQDKAFDGVQYVLAFGQDPKKIMDDHFHKLRIKYALDWSSYVSCVEYFYWKQDYQQVYRYTIMFLENQLFIGEIFEMVQWHFNDYGVPDELHDLAGYVPYEWSVENLQKFRKHDKFLQEMEDEEYMPAYEKNPRTKKGIKEPSKAELVLINRLKKMHELANKNGMKYVPVYEPNMNDFIALDGVHVIYFRDGENYPEYYAIENRWDVKHLNEQGAIIHSELLAKLFEEEFLNVKRDETIKKPKGKKKKSKAKASKSKKEGGKKALKKGSGKRKASKKNAKRASKKKGQKKKAPTN
jgi:hypothetical protein